MRLLATQKRPGPRKCPPERAPSDADVSKPLSTHRNPLHFLAFFPLFGCFCVLGIDLTKTWSLSAWGVNQHRTHAPDLITPHEGPAKLTAVSSLGACTRYRSFRSSTLHFPLPNLLCSSVLRLRSITRAAGNSVKTHGTGCGRGGWLFCPFCPFLPPPKHMIATSR